MQSLFSGGSRSRGLVGSETPSMIKGWGFLLDFTEPAKLFVNDVVSFHFFSYVMLAS